MSDIFNKENFTWKTYYDSVKDSPPRETLVNALSFFEKDENKKDDLYAADLGCGTGKDTVVLLNKGWNVFATDKEEYAIEQLKIRFKNFYDSGKLTVKAESFENLILQETDFVNASYCLPFCKPVFFDNLWEKIDNAIILNGRFAGNFFGENDDWSKFSDMTFHNENQIKVMFADYDIEFFHEKDEDGETACGDKKHWHVFSVVAKKIM